jgi:hypothetical protein
MFIADWSTENMNPVKTPNGMLLDVSLSSEDNILEKCVFDIYFTEYGTALTTVLPILLLYLNTVIVTAGTFEP